ncbi:hypothetical protein [Aestuariivirga sp.]|uniref:hypothetical protein n=1 Tax=Aestuariivirga sp. TaxID=2650926 RepID=UPI00391DE83B
MAKRGPKPKPKGKLKRKRDYSLERRKAAVNNNAGPDSPKARWLQEYIDRINATLPSLIWEDRQLDVDIPEDKPDRCGLDATRGKITQIEVRSDVKMKLNLGENFFVNFRPDWTGPPKVWFPPDVVEAIVHIPSPELYHQNWLPLEKWDAVDWTRIAGLLMPETIAVLKTSRAYANLVNEASRFVAPKRTKPRARFIEIPSNPKAAAKFLRQKDEDILRNEFPPDLIDSKE